MLEILLLYFLCRDIGERIRSRGRKPIGYQILAVVLWISFEFVGAVVGMIAHVYLYGPPESPIFSLALLGGLAGGVTGGLIAFVIALLVPHRPGHQDAGPYV